MTTLVVLVPAAMGGNGLIWGHKFLFISFLVVLYASVLAVLLATLVRHRGEQQSSLSRWRRKVYLTGMVILLVLCSCPVATWPIALSGITLHLRPVVLCLLGVNVVAAILVWFGRGWSRLGLTLVAYWVCYLWLLPLALRD